jgi:hypothetical protein
MESQGLARDLRCDFPFRQSELADMLALSAVHVNRTLMEMRRGGLVSVGGRQLVIHDLPRLQSVAGFDPAYLYLVGRVVRASAVAMPT